LGCAVAGQDAVHGRHGHCCVSSIGAPLHCEQAAEQLVVERRCGGPAGGARVVVLERDSFGEAATTWRQSPWPGHCKLQVVEGDGKERVGIDD
jgi:hypothetical protein